jgi:hypothetical protein
MLRMNLPIVHEDESQAVKPPGQWKVLSCFIYFLLIFAAVMGLAYFGHGLGMLNDQLNYGVSQKAWDYGHQLESEGWRVEYPNGQTEFTPPSGDGSLIYFIATKPGENTSEVYVWEYYRSSERSRTMLRERGISENLWWLPSRSFLIPRSEAALDAHRKLELPLPDGFVLEELDQELTDKMNALIQTN